MWRPHPDRTGTEPGIDGLGGQTLAEPLYPSRSASRWVAVGEQQHRGARRVLIASHCDFTHVDGTVTFRYIDRAGANHVKSLAQPTTDVTPGLRSP